MVAYPPGHLRVSCFFAREPRAALGSAAIPERWVCCRGVEEESLLAQPLSHGVRLKGKVMARHEDIVQSSIWGLGHPALVLDLASTSPWKRCSSSLC